MSKRRETSTSRIVHSGWLNKEGKKKLKVYQSRWVVLYGDGSLAWFLKPGVGQPQNSVIIAKAAVFVEGVVSGEGGQFYFTLQSPEKSWRFRILPVTEGLRWVDQLEKAGAKVVFPDGVIRMAIDDESMTRVKRDSEYDYFGISSLSVNDWSVRIDRTEKDMSSIDWSQAMVRANSPIPIAITVQGGRGGEPRDVNLIVRKYTDDGPLTDWGESDRVPRAIHPLPAPLSIVVVSVIVSRVDRHDPRVVLCGSLTSSPNLLHRSLSLSFIPNEEQVVEYRLALFSYEAKSGNQISFEKGDLISVIEEREGGWWRGRIGDERDGLFPVNYTEPATDEDVEADVPSTPRSLDESMEIHQVRALFDWHSDNPADLHFDRGDIFMVTAELNEDWWIGAHNGKAGKFPCNRVEEFSGFSKLSRAAARGVSRGAANDAARMSRSDGLRRETADGYSSDRSADGSYRARSNSFQEDSQPHSHASPLSQKSFRAGDDAPAPSQLLRSKSLATPKKRRDSRERKESRERRDRAVSSAREEEDERERQRQPKEGIVAVSLDRYYVNDVAVEGGEQFCVCTRATQLVAEGGAGVYNIRIPNAKRKKPYKFSAVANTQFPVAIKTCGSARDCIFVLHEKSSNRKMERGKDWLIEGQEFRQEGEVEITTLFITLKKEIEDLIRITASLSDSKSIYVKVLKEKRPPRRVNTVLSSATAERKDAKGPEELSGPARGVYEDAKKLLQVDRSKWPPLDALDLRRLFVRIVALHLDEEWQTNGGEKAMEELGDHVVDRVAVLEWTESQEGLTQAQQGEQRALKRLLKVHEEELENKTDESVYNLLKLLN